MAAPTLDDLRRYAVARTLFPLTTLARAITKLGFVQADPIRAPARAQDLTLRHRVKDYRAGDLERRYPQLDVEEDVFVNYGFLPRANHALMHPRVVRSKWSRARARSGQAVLDFIRERGEVHPREVDAHFGLGRITNWFGGSSNASTQLLDAMHYRGMLRVARREGGIRMYSAQDHPPRPEDAEARRQRIDALVDMVVRKYSPMPARSLAELVGRLRYAAPQLAGERRAALERATQRLPNSRIDGVTWYWPEAERPRASRDAFDTVRLLTPFDPVVWDRRRFSLFWDWSYRFEAYTPPAKRKLGYYALPLLWRDRVIGWGNVAAIANGLEATFGYVTGAAPKEPAFKRELEAELHRMRRFLVRRPAEIRIEQTEPRTTGRSD